MHSVLIVTISGPDRPGLVEQLAEVVAAHSGNWEHCRMAHLADRFVGLLQISVPGDRQQELEVALRLIEELDVMISASEEGAAERTDDSFRIEVVGSDRPGIVRDVFAAIAASGANVEELSTDASSARDTSGLLFSAKARLSGASSIDRDALQGRLEEIAHDIMVDIKVID